MRRLRKKKRDRELTTYDRFNLPLRGLSGANQTSRELRGWISMLRQYSGM